MVGADICRYECAVPATAEGVWARHATCLDGIDRVTDVPVR
jgi:hypothetical protein